ncbi:MAG: hypothetical protein EBQ99_05670 [Planctomycetes bacterium]|nr:hypothetical protein [Planctomycetota bacterium]
MRFLPVVPGDPALPPQLHHGGRLHRGGRGCRGHADRHRAGHGAGGGGGGPAGMGRIPTGDRAGIPRRMTWDHHA